MGSHREVGFERHSSTFLARREVRARATTGVVPRARSAQLLRVPVEAPRGPRRYREAGIFPWRYHAARLSEEEEPHDERAWSASLVTRARILYWLAALVHRVEVTR